MSQYSPAVQTLSSVHVAAFTHWPSSQTWPAPQSVSVVHVSGLCSQRPEIRLQVWPGSQSAGELHVATVGVLHNRPSQTWPEPQSVDSVHSGREQDAAPPPGGV